MPYPSFPVPVVARSQKATEEEERYDHIVIQCDSLSSARFSYTSSIFLEHLAIDSSVTLVLFFLFCLQFPLSLTHSLFGHLYLKSE